MAYKTQIVTFTRDDGFAFTSIDEADTYLRDSGKDFTAYDKAITDAIFASDGEIVDGKLVSTWTMTTDYATQLANAPTIEIPGITITMGAAGEVDTHPDLD